MSTLPNMADGQNSNRGHGRVLRHQRSFSRATTHSAIQRSGFAPPPLVLTPRNQQRPHFPQRGIPSLPSYMTRPTPLTHPEYFRNRQLHRAIAPRPINDDGYDGDGDESVAGESIARSTYRSSQGSDTAGSSSRERSARPYTQTYYDSHWNEYSVNSPGHGIEPQDRESFEETPEQRDTGYERDDSDSVSLTQEEVQKLIEIRELIVQKKLLENGGNFEELLEQYTEDSEPILEAQRTESPTLGFGKSQYERELPDRRVSNLTTGMRTLYDEDFYESEASDDTIRGVTQNACLKSQSEPVLLPKTEPATLPIRSTANTREEEELAIALRNLELELEMALKEEDEAEKEGKVTKRGKVTNKRKVIKGKKINKEGMATTKKSATNEGSAAGEERATSQEIITKEKGVKKKKTSIFSTLRLKKKERPTILPDAPASEPSHPVSVAPTPVAPTNPPRHVYRYEQQQLLGRGLGTFPMCFVAVESSAAFPSHTQRGSDTHSSQ